MAELKTKPTEASVDEFLEGVADPRRRADCRSILGLMRQATKCEPMMWGESIVGFGHVHYRYASGHEGDTFILGFAPRKAALTLYISSGLESCRETIERLGKVKAGKGCLYIRSLDEIDVAALTALLAEATEEAARLQMREA